MRKKIISLLSSSLLVACTASGASAFALNDWFFDIDGAGGAPSSQITEFFDIISPNFVDTTFTSATTYDFTNYGFTTSSGHDGGTPYANNNYQLTGIYTYNGDASLSGDVNFTSGSFDLFVQDVNAPGGTIYSTTGDSTIYGANDGTNIASFDVVSGSGMVDPFGLPNGQFSINYEATSMAAGYFFLPDGTDMAFTNPISLVLGYSTTNASATMPSAAVESELYEYAGYAGPALNDPPIDFFVSANGQFRIDAVPEPTTMVLFGAGLLGLAGTLRRKAKK